MSITIDYFFNRDKPLPQVADEINAWLGCHLAPYQGNSQDYFCRFLGMELSLSVHRCDNDRDLDFENYRYEIGIRTPIGDADFRPLQLPVMAFVVYALYRRVSITGMLVFDVQHLLARYREAVNAETNEASLFDEVSKEFVSYPKHINDLMRRMPAGSFSDAWEEPTIWLLESEGKHIEIPGKK